MPGRPGLRLDLTGHRSGLLTVLENTETFTKDGKRIWRCRCDCGNETLVGAHNLKNKHTISCGCAYRATGSVSLQSEAKLLYSNWQKMKQRCTRPADPSYARYGGRGITVCPEWLASFEAFMADMGPRPTQDHSVERRDNDGPYCPGNCYWATRSQQARNKRNIPRFTLNGEAKTLAEWCETTPIKPSTVRQRFYSLKWPLEDALYLPKGTWRKL